MSTSTTDVRKNRGIYGGEIPKFTPYTLNVNHIRIMYKTYRNILGDNYGHPLNDEIRISRSQRYISCGGCKESLVVGDCVIRYGSKGHFCHYPECYGLVFYGDEEEESSISPSSISPEESVTND